MKPVRSASSQSALARVGINALVDEATGYQNVRESDALRELLKTYVAEDFLDWENGLPNNYYSELRRLHGCGDGPLSDANRKQAGAFTKRYVYDHLWEAVLGDIKVADEAKKAMRKQIINGAHAPLLVHHIIKLVAIMQLSESMDHFKQNFQKIFGDIEKAAEAKKAAQDSIKTTANKVVNNIKSKKEGSND